MRKLNKDDKRPSKKKRIVLLFMFLLIVILYITIPFGIKIIMSSQLSALGFDSSFQISKITSHQITISDFVITQKKKPNSKRLSINNITVDYDFIDLLKTQTLENIDISNLDIDYILKNSKNSNKQSILNSKNLLPQSLLNQIPAKKITINNISISSQITNNFSVNLLGNAHYNDGKLLIDLRYSDNKQEKAVFKAQLDMNNEFSINAQLIQSGALPNSQFSKTASNKKIKKPSLSLNMSGAFNTTNNEAIILEFNQEIIFSNFEINSYELGTHFVNKYFSADYLVFNNILKQLSRTQGTLTADHKITLPSTLSLSKFSSNNFSGLSSFKSAVKTSNTHLFINNLLPQKHDINLPKIDLVLSGNISLKNNDITFSIQPDTSLTLIDPSILDIKNKKINIKLSSLFKATLLSNSSKNLKYTKDTINKIKFNDFKIVIEAQTWNTFFGTLSHHPIKLYLTDIDSKIKSAAIRYELNEVSVIPASKKGKSVFQQLRTNITGKLSIKDNIITSKIDHNTAFNIDNINTLYASTNNVEFITETPFKLVYDAKTNDIKVDDFSLLLSENTWKNPLALIKNQPFVLNFSKLDLSKKTGLMTTSNLETNVSLKHQPLESVSAKTQFKTNINKKSITVSIAKNSHLSLRNIHTPIKIKQLDINSDLPIVLNLPINITTSGQRDLEKSISAIKISPIRLNVSSTPIAVEKKVFSYNSFVTNIKTESLIPLNINANSKLKGVHSVNHPDLNSFNIYSTHRFNKKDYQGYHKITNTELPISLALNVNSYNYFQTLLANWSIKPIDLAVDGKKIQRSLKSLIGADLINNITINKGSYQFSGKLKSRIKEEKTQINLTAEHQINNLSMNFKDIFLSNINYSGEFKLNNSNLTHSGKLSADEVKRTLPIKNISTDFILNNLLSNERSATLKNTSATLLDAQLQLNKITIPINSLQGSSSLYFTGLPLNNVLALEQQPSLSGSGELKGKLPFKFSKNKLWVNNGEISASKNGYIRYTANESIKTTAATNTGLKIALDVLEDFHYNTLSINMNYTPDGQLLLSNHLVGKNPKWQNGQPIDFTINVEENVLQLLKAIQYSDNLTDKIEQKINKSKED